MVLVVIYFFLIFKSNINRSKSNIYILLIKNCEYIRIIFVKKFAKFAFSHIFALPTIKITITTTKIVHMSNKTKINAKVFKTAWQILKGGFAANFGQALKKAWLIIKISAGKATTIVFAKETGEYREAVAVLTGGLDTIASGFVRFVEMVEGKAQWRSFRITNLSI